VQDEEEMSREHVKVQEKDAAGPLQAGAADGAHVAGGDGRGPTWTSGSVGRGHAPLFLGDSRSTGLGRITPSSHGEASHDRSGSENEPKHARPFDGVFRSRRAALLVVCTVDTLASQAGVAVVLRNCSPCSATSTRCNGRLQWCRLSSRASARAAQSQSGGLTHAFRVAAFKLTPPAPASDDEESKAADEGAANHTACHRSGCTNACCRVPSGSPLLCPSNTAALLQGHAVVGRETDMDMWSGDGDCPLLFFRSGSPYCI
jgi:hypothetical protein